MCNKSVVGLCLISVTKPEDRKGNGCGSSCAVPHEACIAFFFTVTASGCDNVLTNNGTGMILVVAVPPSYPHQIHSILPDYDNCGD